MKYTYLVEHEDGKEPTINQGMTVFGGRLVAVAFGDEFERIEQLEAELAKAKREAQK